MSDEDPVDGDAVVRRGRTPAERAGATPLDPERLRAEAMPVVRRRRRADDAASDAGELTTTRRARRPRRGRVDEPPVIRRRRRQRSSRRWFGVAAALALLGLVAGLVAWLTDPSVDAADGAPTSLVAATPALSARRAPELLARPVAARNLRDAVAPILAAAPPNSCFEVRDRTEPLVAHRETAPLVPASNMKLLVAAAALDLLDPNERLVTRFATDGAPTDGSVVRGNLYMIGGGDPMLTTDSYKPLFTNGVPPLTDLEAVADQIAGTGITEITGSVVGDGSRYDDVRVVPAWPERFLTQGQVAPLAALVVNDGWTVDPLAAGVGGGPAADPVLHAAQVMTALLQRRGIEVAGAPGRGVAPAGATALVEIPSMTIAELVGELLRFSDNTTTELLVKELGVRAGEGGSTAAGLRVLHDWAASSGLDTSGVAFDDGSGLSLNDRLTCRFLSSLLAEDGAGGPIADGMATPGEPGTLDDRMLQEPLRSAVRAKTGTLRSVSALSGWLRTRHGSDLAFSFIVNTTDRQVGGAELDLQRQLLEAMTDHPRSPPLDALSPAAPRATS